LFPLFFNSLILFSDDYAAVGTVSKKQSFSFFLYIPRTNKEKALHLTVKGHTLYSENPQ